MLPKNGRPIHHGKYIQHTYLLPRKISKKQLADAIGITLLSINDVLLEKSSITADMAYRLARFFNTSADFWIPPQMHVDLWDTFQMNKDDYDRIKGIA